MKQRIEEVLKKCPHLKKKAKIVVEKVSTSRSSQGEEKYQGLISKSLIKEQFLVKLIAHLNKNDSLGIVYLDLC